MIKMIRRVLLTFLVFFCTYFIVFIIESKLLSNITVRENLIKTTVYSCIYLIAILVCTRKNKQLITRILFSIGILIVFITAIWSVMTGKQTAKVAVKWEIAFWINAIVIGIQLRIADMQGKKYKEEKKIRQKEKEKQIIQFEEINKEGVIKRKGKIKLR